MKYIIFQDFAGQPVPFIFPPRVAHSDMREQLPYAKPISAGRVRLEQGRFVCSADDTGLDVGTRPEDAELIRAAFQEDGHGAGCTCEACQGKA